MCATHTHGAFACALLMIASEWSGAGQMQWCGGLSRPNGACLMQIFSPQYSLIITTAVTSRLLSHELFLVAYGGAAVMLSETFISHPHGLRQTFTFTASNGAWRFVHLVGYCFYLACLLEEVTQGQRARKKDTTFKKCRTCLEIGFNVQFIPNQWTWQYMYVCMYMSTRS